MAKQTINVGSNELAGDGESLRSAFQKINSNFDELYLNGGGGVGPTGPTGPTGPIGPQDFSAIAEHVLPAEDLTYDLGSLEKQWRSLYVGTSTVYIGGVPVSVNTASNTLVIGTSTNTTEANLATEFYVDQAVASSQRLEIDGGFASTNYTAEIEIDGGGA